MTITTHHRRAFLKPLVLAGAAAALALLAGGTPPASANPGTTERVSVAYDGSQGNRGSWWPSMSADGRFVAFGSHASNLVATDSNGYEDVFVYDRHTGTVERVSVASDATQGNWQSGFPSISADGRYVAFISWASNLVPGDTNGYRDVFVHDRQTGITDRVSLASDATQANGPSGWDTSIAITADGRLIAFVSDANNLVANDTNGLQDVFVHDRGPVAPPPPDDTDGDGIPDAEDDCPNTDPEEAVDANGCTQGQAKKAAKEPDLAPPGLVVIDPGHGGSASGAVGCQGSLEKQLTLQISTLVKDNLTASGYSVLLTREADVNVGIVQRAQLANDNDADAFLSIHMNSSKGDCAGHGKRSEAFYAKGRPAAEAFAADICRVIRVRFENRSCSVKPDTATQVGQLGVLRNITPDTRPAALFEVVFIDNLKDFNLLQARITDFAQAIADGIECHLRTKRCT